MKKALVLSIILVFFATVAFAATPSYKSPNSINEYIQVKNTSAAALGKGAPVTIEATEYTTNDIIGVEGADSTIEIVVGVLTDTLEVGAVGTAITYGFGYVLVDEACAAGAILGTTTTAGEADDNNTNVQSMFATALELASARSVIECFIQCK